MTFTVDEITALLGGSDDEWLFAEADKVKRGVYGNEVFLRGIIETSSYCRNNCLYCGLHVDSPRPRYRLDADTIIATADTIRAAGITSVVLQAGEEPSPENIRLLNTVIPAIKERTGADITLSHGDFSDEVYAEWKRLGADRYLIKMETMDPELHALARPGCSAPARLDRIKALLGLGYQVGSGFIAGMPGYTNAMLARDMLEMSKLGIHMFSLSPFIATPGTPWAGEPDAEPMLVHRACAVYRLLDPATNIPFTNALNVMEPAGRKIALSRGCNVVMHSFTPASFRKDYEIYTGKGVVRDEALDALAKIRDDIAQQGLVINSGNPGRSKKGD